MKLNMTELRDGITSLHGIHVLYVLCLNEQSPCLFYQKLFNLIPNMPILSQFQIVLDKINIFHLEHTQINSKMLFRNKPVTKY